MFNITSERIDNCFNEINATQCMLSLKNDSEIVSCQSYIYDVEGVHPKMFSLLMEFDLVCEKDWIPESVNFSKYNFLYAIQYSESFSKIY